VCFGPVSLFYLFSFIYHHVCVMLSASRLAFYIVDLVACTLAALKGVQLNGLSRTHPCLGLVYDDVPDPVVGAELKLRV